MQENNNNKKNATVSCENGNVGRKLKNAHKLKLLKSDNIFVYNLTVSGATMLQVGLFL